MRLRRRRRWILFKDLFWKLFSCCDILLWMSWSWHCSVVIVFFSSNFFSFIFVIVLDRFASSIRKRSDQPWELEEAHLMKDKIAIPSLFSLSAASSSSWATFLPIKTIKPIRGFKLIILRVKSHSMSSLSSSRAVLSCCMYLVMESKYMSADWMSVVPFSLSNALFRITYCVIESLRKSVVGPYPTACRTCKPLPRRSSSTSSPDKAPLTSQ